MHCAQLLAKHWIAEQPDQEDRIFNDQKERSKLKQAIVVEARKNAVLVRLPLKVAHSA
jgi:hypothetical protein